ncbi:hypothetical protein J3E72DRAFT_361394, partial [Bipolaris maydis]
MDQPAEPERLNKRKRVALACDACRERKIRCDGAKPCRPCEKRGEPAHACLYTVSTTAKHVSEQEYIASLQRQVRELHATVEDLKTSPFQAPPQRVSGSPSTRDAQREEIPVHAIVDVEGPSPVSAMGAVATSQRGPFGDEEFYGQSSVHSLLQEVPHGDHRRGPLGATSMPWRYNGNLMIQAHYALPPRNIADRLIDRFFQNVHIFYPWCHSVSFRARYESLWTKEGYPEPSVLLHRDIGLGGD